MNIAIGMKNVIRLKTCSEISPRSSMISPRSVTTILKKDIDSTVKIDYFDISYYFQAKDKVARLEKLWSELQNTGLKIKIQANEKYTKYDIMQKIILFAQIRDLADDQGVRFTFSIDSGTGLFVATNPMLNLWINNQLVLACSSYNIFQYEQNNNKKLLPETAMLYLTAGNIYAIDDKKYEAKIMYRFALTTFMSACKAGKYDLKKTVGNIERLCAESKEFNTILDEGMENLIGNFFEELGDTFFMKKDTMNLANAMTVYQLAKAHYLMANNEGFATKVNNKLVPLNEYNYTLKAYEKNLSISIVKSKDISYLYVNNQLMGSKIRHVQKVDIGGGNMGTVYMYGGNELVTKYTAISETDMWLLQKKIDKTLLLHNNLQQLELGRYVLLNYYKKDSENDEGIYVGRAVPNPRKITLFDVDANIRWQVLEIAFAIHFAGGFALDTKPDNIKFGSEKDGEDNIYRFDVDLDIELLAILDRYDKNFIFSKRVFDIMEFGSGYEKVWFYTKSKEDYLAKKLLGKYKNDYKEKIIGLLRIRGLLGSVIAFLPKYELVEQHNATTKYTSEDINKFRDCLEQHVPNIQPKDWHSNFKKDYFKKELIGFIISWVSITTKMDRDDKENLDKVIKFIDKYSNYIKSQQEKLLH